MRVTADRAVGRHAERPTSPGGAEYVPVRSDNHCVTIIVSEPVLVGATDVGEDDGTCGVAGKSHRRPSRRVPHREIVLTQGFEQGSVTKEQDPAVADGIVEALPLG